MITPILLGRLGWKGKSILEELLLETSRDSKLTSDRVLDLHGHQLLIRPYNLLLLP